MSQNSKPVAVIGAGIAGLAAAHFLRRHNVPVVLLEAGSQIAGMSQSYVDKQGFRYDIGAHFITNRLAAAVGIAGQCRTVERYGESVLIGDTAYSYPFGLMKVPRFALGAVGAKFRPGRQRQARTAADWFRASFGSPFARDVGLPILEAWSGTPADQLSPAVGDKLKNSVWRTTYLKYCSWRRGRATSIGYSHEMPEHVNVWHVYPNDGVSRICERLAADVSDDIEMESPVEEIVVENDRVAAIKAGGTMRDVSAVVSTIPCPILPKLITGTEALAPLAQFRFRPMIFVCLRYEIRGILPTTVLWTADGRAVFFRLTETAHSMPWLAPEGKTLITADVGCQMGDDLWAMDDDALGERCADDMETIYPGTRRHYAGCRVMRSPIAYPIYHLNYEVERRRFAECTGVAGLYSIGRNGEFAHILMEDVYWRTIKKMNHLISWRQGAGRNGRI